MADGSIDVTVAICTYNRASMLRDTLQEMTRLRVPGDCEWELLVVNNASTDDTDQVVRSFEARVPVRLVHEPQSGKSHAANAAVRQARGRYIVWTDDDVLVSPQWLEEYCKAFDADPDVLMFGGPIDAHFLGDPPPWADALLRVEGRVWAVVDPGPTPKVFTKELIPLGANMALRREAHLRHPFDVRVGPRPRSEIRGEETLVIHQLMDEGERGLWLPHARVRHIVPKHRQSLSYVRRFSVGLGRTFAILYEPAPGDFLGRPLWAWRQALSSSIRYLVSRWSRPPERWLKHLMDAAFAWGFLGSRFRL